MQITERSLYSPLGKMINERGGTSVQEVKYNSQPDILFNFLQIKWILSVKIGETPKILKDAFIQYHRHKDESGIEYGLILFIPEKIRQSRVDEEILIEDLRATGCTCLIDTPYVKEEISDITFPDIIMFIQREVFPRIQKEEKRSYPLSTVIKFLQIQVQELMGTIRITDEEMIKVITDKKLLTGIGSIDTTQADEVTKFIASFIVLSQILFLRLFSRTNNRILPPMIKGGINHHWLRSAFNNILNINYRPIFEINVLDALTEDYLRDTFDLIWALEIEKIRYELPGRIFHELMPHGIRKLLAAFYTRPIAADLLATLSIQKSGDTVYDPACGSGTILVSAYKRKLHLAAEEGLRGNPHKRYCESEIFGSDIMPFAVHLASANLSAIDPGTTIERTQIIQEDSLKLTGGSHYPSGIQLDIFPTAKQSSKHSGERYEVTLDKTDVILMNPPFTKVERGISEYVSMGRFGNICGNEIGLWGHFLALGDSFLKEDGIFGGVIPISILRGRETLKIRNYIFSKWTPLYIIKTTFNYGFSEWSEYRDILFIARKATPQKNDKVKFILIKQDLTQLKEDDIPHLVSQIENNDSLISANLDIDIFSMKDVREHFNNLMWFCGISSFRNRNSLTAFIRKSTIGLGRLPENYFREGYRPVPKGVSSFMFLTRASHEARTEAAFLTFAREGREEYVTCRTKLGTEYTIEKTAIKSSLRTGIGLPYFDLGNKVDYIAQKSYHDFSRISTASKFKKPLKLKWAEFWRKVQTELETVETNIVTLHRINPYSPSTHHISYYNIQPFSPSNVLNVVIERDKERAKAACVIFNSIVFFAQFILLKEETTGRYINIRFYDFYEMLLYPDEEKLASLVEIFDKNSNVSFPSLRIQFDINFDAHYKEFWDKRKSAQLTLPYSHKLEASDVRLNFDLDVCEALGCEIDKDDLTDIYKIIAEEMIITKGLVKD